MLQKNSCGPWAYLPLGMWNPPGAGIKPWSPPLPSGFFTTDIREAPESLFFFFFTTKSKSKLKTVLVRMKLNCCYKYKIFSDPKAVEVYFPLMQQLRTGVHAGRPLSSTYRVALLSSVDATAPLGSWQKWKESQKNLNTYFWEVPAQLCTSHFHSKPREKENWILGACLAIVLALKQRRDWSFVDSWQSLP